MTNDRQPVALGGESSDKEKWSRVIPTRILIPARRKDLFRRQRLLDFIHEHTPKKLILVSAAAGYGKTSLLIDFAHDTPLPVCWYSISESDDDPRTFLEYLVASIAHRFPQILEGKLNSLFGATTARFDPQTVVGVLITEVEQRIPEPFCLILDDYHHIGETSPLNRLLDTFFEQQPTNVTFILSSRTLPNISLLRLTARQEVAGLGSEDLRFTAEEIREFLFQKHSITVTVDQAQKLATESEGWITAIVLSMHTLWKGLLQTLIRARGKGEYVYDYLAQEILTHQEEEVQDFLKNTSIFTSMDAGLCDQVLDRTDSAAMLELLERRNLFVTKIPGTPINYRYHDLFRNFLADQLRTQQPALFEQLHLQSGVLFRERKEWNQALTHFVAARDYQAAAQIVEEHGWEMVTSGKLGTLASWLDALPEQMRAGCPSLLLLKGRLHAERGQIDAAEGLYRRAENLARADSNWHQLAQVLVEEASVLQEKTQNEEALHKCNQVIQLISSVSLEDKLMARVYRISGKCLVLAESLPAAEEKFRKALELCQREKDLFYTANVLQDLGTLLRRKGNAEQAQELYQRSLSLFEEIGNVGRAAEVLNNIAVGYHYEGEYTRALKTFQKALAKAEEGINMRAKGAILASLGDIYRELGQPTRAVELYSEALGIAGNIGDGFLMIYSQALLGEAYSATGQFEKANKELAAAEELASQQEAKYPLALVRVSRGISEYERGNLEPSIQYLRSACHLLEQFGAERELARARLHLAYTLSRAGHRPEADDQLGLAIKLSQETGYCQLLLADGRMMMPFFRKSLARHIGKGVARGLLKRIQDFPPPDTLEAFGIEEVVPAVPYLEIRAFGNEHVILDGKRVPQSAWGGPLVRELFFYILDQGPVALDEIGLVFWPDYSSAKMKSIFHSTMYRLRRLIPPDFLIYEDDSAAYLFNRGQKYNYDMEEFKKVSDLALGEELSEQDIIENGSRAIELYTGEFLRDSSLTWCLRRRENLRQKFINVLMRLAMLHKRGRLEESILLYQKAIEEDPFLERAQRELMRCYVLRGERTRAIKHYLAYSEYLMEELGVAPSDKTTDLYDAILHGKLTEYELDMAES